MKSSLLYPFLTASMILLIGMPAFARECPDTIILEGNRAATLTHLLENADFTKKVVTKDSINIKEIFSIEHLQCTHFSGDKTNDTTDYQCNPAVKNNFTAKLLYNALVDANVIGDASMGGVNDVEAASIQCTIMNDANRGTKKNARCKIISYGLGNDNSNCY